MNPKNLLVLLLLILIPLAAGFISSLTTRNNQTEQYAEFKQPSFAPPGWLFGPVWTLLYILMGGATYLVWRSGTATTGVKTALIIFFVQLLFNILWTFIFFGLNLRGLAFAEIILLWILILVNIILYWRIKPIAGILLLPYIFWVSFASLLNFSIWQLNKS